MTTTTHRLLNIVSYKLCNWKSWCAQTFWIKTFCNRWSDSRMGVGENIGRIHEQKYAHKFCFQYNGDFSRLVETFVHYHVQHLFKIQLLYTHVCTYIFWWVHRYMDDILNDYLSIGRFQYHWQSLHNLRISFSSFWAIFMYAIC